MRLCFVSSVRRFVGLALFLFFALPFGLSVIGCGHKSTPAQFCSAGDSGPVVGQVAAISLSPTLATTGESLNYGQIGSALSASATDCKGNAVSVSKYTFASTSSYTTNTTGVIIADINPNNGQVCGGTWNRNTGGGIPDYTTCTPPPSAPSQYLALVTATAAGATSNAIPIYVHPVVTGVVLGAETPTGGCTAAGGDPGTDCCPNSTVGTVTPSPIYDGYSCVSQHTVNHLVARVYEGNGTSPANNITCQVGHLTFAPLTAGIVTIDQNGTTTANLPGSSVITATVANSSTATNAGFFSTCPPKSIVLSVPNQPAGTDSINVGLNNTQPLTVTVTDTNNQIITGLSLEYNSTTPQTIPATASSVTPVFPGSADITVVCQPPTCNSAPFSQIGLNGNGKPVTSNPITINTPGTSSTVIYVGSTGSQYVLAHDFTTNQPGALIKLPFLPNSMVINQSGSTIYFGSDSGLMSISTATNALGTTNQAVQGTVLSISPDGGTVVVTDSKRQTISLVAGTTGTATTVYGGVGTHAQWSPDSQTVYVTTLTNNIVLTHSTYTDWQSAVTEENYTDVAVTVPSVGAYFAGPRFTDGRSYCSATTIGAGSPPDETNAFIPLVDQQTVTADRLAATTDGQHILGAHAAGTASTLSDFVVTLPLSDTPYEGACPIPPAAQPGLGFFKSNYKTLPIPGINAFLTPYSTPLNAPTAITGVVPSSNSAAAFVTYTGLSGLLPVYFPSTTGAGTLKTIALSGGATAPLAGVFSTDNFSFYVGTSGDNQVHIITLAYPTGATPTATESGVLTPQLPAYTGSGFVPVNMIVQRPKKSTS